MRIAIYPNKLNQSWGDFRKSNKIYTQYIINYYYHKKKVNFSIMKN